MCKIFCDDSSDINPSHGDDSNAAHDDYTVNELVCLIDPAPVSHVADLGSLKISPGMPADRPYQLPRFWNFNCGVACVRMSQWRAR